MVNNNKIHPWYLTGLIDAEGSLGVNITKDVTRKSNYIITLFFEIGLNVKDKTLLEHIQASLNVGNIYYKSVDKTFRFKVSNLKQLSGVIIPHLTDYPLLTKKRADFELFKKILNIIEGKKHLTFNGLQEIVNLKASLNNGLSNKLKILFPNTIAAVKPTVNINVIPDPHWLSGFAEGEACFFISVYKSLGSRCGLSVQLVFRITQHSRDIGLMNTIAEFFGCGRIEKRNTEACDFTVNSLKAFELKIIPFFSTYTLQGSKYLDFKDFNKVVNIMKIKGHLTDQGLNTIKNIKAGMNTGRKIKII